MNIPKIYLAGDELTIKKFIDYAYGIPDYFVNIGVEKPEFIMFEIGITDSEEAKKCRVFNLSKILEKNRNSYVDTLDIIMIHYI